MQFLLLTVLLNVAIMKVLAEERPLAIEIDRNCVGNEFRHVLDLIADCTLENIGKQAEVTDDMRKEIYRVKEGIEDRRCEGRTSGPCFMDAIDMCEFALTIKKTFSSLLEGNTILEDSRETCKQQHMDTSGVFDCYKESLTEDGWNKVMDCFMPEINDAMDSDLEVKCAAVTRMDACIAKNFKGESLEDIRYIASMCSLPKNIHERCKIAKK